MNQEVRKDLHKTYGGYTFLKFIDRKKSCILETTVTNEVIKDLCEKP